MTLQVNIHTDGSSHGNPGPGGYAAILQYGDQERVVSGNAPDTTNNQMELMAAIAGMRELRQMIDQETLHPDVQVNLHSDSKYVINPFNDGWITGWQKNGWRTAKKTPVAHQDLWKKLLRLTENRNMTYTWVKGHSGEPTNERCDQIANEEADRATPPAAPPAADNPCQQDAYAAGRSALWEEISAFVQHLDSGPPPAFETYVDGYRICRRELIQYIHENRNDPAGLPF